MEGKTKHEFVLKKTVAMFNKLTGKRMTAREGNQFLDLYDFVSEYASPEAQEEAAPAAPVELTPWQQASLETTTERAPGALSLEIPTFVGREVEQAVAAAPEPAPELAAAADALNVSPAVLTQVAATETAPPARPRFTFEPPAAAAPAPARSGKYAPPPIRTNDREHIQGYDWQLVVLCREKNPENSYIMHYAEKPKQAEFNEHYALYDAKTHYVHLNEWKGRDWVGITHNFSGHYYKPNPNQKPGRDVSAPALADPWEEDGKAFRIRYYSDVLGAVRYQYVDKKPSGSEMAHFHHTKCLAVVQARPKEAA